MVTSPKISPLSHICFNNDLFVISSETLSPTLSLSLSLSLTIVKHSTSFTYLRKKESI